MDKTKVINKLIRQIDYLRRLKEKKMDEEIEIHLSMAEVCLDRAIMGIRRQVEKFPPHKGGN